MHLPPIRSKQEDFIVGSTVEFDNWVPPRGGAGGRNVIRGFFLKLFGTITVATADFDGRDVARLIARVAVQDRSGRLRWALSGASTRLATILYCGIERHIEHATIAQGAGAAVSLMLYIPMAKPRVVRGEDFALPADVLDKVIVTFNSYASAATGATVLSAADLDCYILADLREEHNVEIKSEDAVKSVNFQGTTQAQVKLSGTVHDAFIAREAAAAGTAGGESVSTLEDLRCDELNIPPQKNADLKAWYTHKFGYGNTSNSATAGEVYKDPFRAGQALAFIIADEDTSVWDGKVVTDAKIDLGTGAAGLSLVTREVLPKSQENFNAQAAQFGINPDVLRAKTAGKTNRDIGAYGKRAKQVMPFSAPLRR